MALANAPGFEPKVPIEYHPYQYQNKDWYEAIDDRFYFPTWEQLEEEERARSLADWQERLAKEDQQERNIAKQQRQATNKKLKPHRWPYKHEA